MSDMVNGPAPVTGTSDEREANFASHAFGEERCMFCDCKPWHLSASYPCGATVPRATYTEAE